VGEFFSGVIQPGYHTQLNKAYHHQRLAARISVTHKQYESFYNYAYPIDGSELKTPVYQKGQYRLSGMAQHKRLYETVQHS
jgi:hydroxymethylglutaryl-CoA synthase